jgi:hypothetical protein
MDRGSVVRMMRSRSGGRMAGIALTCAVVVVALVVVLASLALAAGPTFPDVPATHPYYTAVSDLAGRGIIGGYADGKFGPGDPVTRQQFAKMIVLTAGYPVSESDVCYFTDVEKSGPSSLYPDNYVAVCAARGITTGKTATTFDATGNISRYQMLSMVVRTVRDLQPGLLATPPAGWTSSAGWDDDPVHGANAAVAEYNGLLAGLDLSVLNPYGNMTRGEVAQVLHNLLVKLSPPPTTTTTATTVTTTSSTTTSTTSSTTTTTAVWYGQNGTKDNPVPVDAAFQIGDWRITVTGVLANATQTILQYSPLNPSPPNGTQYVLIHLAATYLGVGSDSFWLTYDWRFIGSKGTVFADSFSYAVAPDSIFDVGVTPHGGSAYGNLLFLVSSDQVNDGLLMLKKRGDTTGATQTYYRTR